MNGKEEVWNEAEAFRRAHLVGGLQHLPVDVFSLTELRLRLDVIPFGDALRQVRTGRTSWVQTML